MLALKIVRVKAKVVLMEVETNAFLFMGVNINVVMVCIVRFSVMINSLHKQLVYYIRAILACLWFLIFYREGA
jgi:hypothetical protein